MTDIQCVFESMTGKGSIYISNYAAAQNLKLLQSKDIKAVLSVAKSGLLKHNKQDIPFYLYLPAHDHQEYDIYQFFNQAYDFIELSRKHTNVLVHCMAGVSRSVTIVIAYLLKKYKCSLGEVIMILQRKRNKINPNKGFIEQLKKYAQQQGLKCNFDFEQVQIRRDRSYSKDKTAKSRPKSNIMNYNTTNSPTKCNNQKKIQDNVEKETICDDSIRKNINEGRKNQKEQSLGNSKQKELGTKKKDLLLSSNNRYQDIARLKTQKLKEDHTFDENSPKKQSIEEKIIKLRKKILQNDAKKSIQKQKEEKYDKQNESFNSKNNNFAIANTNLSQYFSLYAKTHPLSIKITHQKSLQKQRRQKVKKQDELMKQMQIQFCKTEGKAVRKYI